MLGTEKIVAFAAVRDRDAARTFYRDTLGLRLQGEDQFAMVFDANGTTLRVVPVKDWTPPQFTVLGWEVGDIEAVVTWLSDRGVSTEKYPFVADKELGIWTAPSGDKVAWFKDPDGNVLSVSYHP